MPDISMCLNKRCKLKQTCKRYMSAPSPFMQTYTAFNFAVTDVIVTCENYWKMEKLNGIM